ncbi:MAG: hypothetical protein HUK22_04045 [Thermoguttaceae bacterium]|nr:hypothetical protein [Thermoguttaceae bacterium]
MSSEKNGRVKAPSDIKPVRYEPKTKYGRDEYRADGALRRKYKPPRREYAPPERVPETPSDGTEDAAWGKGTLIALGAVAAWFLGVALILGVIYFPYASFFEGMFKLLAATGKGVVWVIKTVVPVVVFGLSSLAMVVSLFMIFGALGDGDKSIVFIGIIVLVVSTILNDLSRWGMGGESAIFTTVSEASAD